MSNYPSWTTTEDLTSEDYLDSRDMEAWLNWWDEDMIAEEDESNGDTSLAGLRATILEIREECEGYGWEHGILFVRESYWEEYARQLAEDVGAIDRNAAWPACHIDWGAAADALMRDYNESDVGRMTYYWQEA